MTEKLGEFYEEEDIDLMPYAIRLFKSWKFVLKAGVIGIVVGLVFALSAVKSYTSSAELAPELTQKSTNSNLSSLASLAGVNLNNVNMTDAMYPDLYPEIVASIPFAVDLLKMPVADSDLYTYLDKGQKYPWYQVLKWAKAKFKKAGPDEDSVLDIDPEQMSLRQAEIVRDLQESISVVVDKKTAIINVSATLQDPVLSKKLCDLVVERLTEYIVRYRTEKARKDVEYYQLLNEEARSEYYSIQKKYAEYSDANQGITRNSYLIERERLKNETDLAFQLYNQTSQQLKNAQAAVQQETPVCVTIKPSTVPIKGTPSRAKILMTWVFLFAFFATLWVLLCEMIKEFKKKLKEQ